jgi:hypothetical protein
MESAHHAGEREKICEPPSAKPHSKTGRRSSLADLAALDHDGLQI